MCKKWQAMDNGHVVGSFEAQIKVNIFMNLLWYSEPLLSVLSCPDNILSDPVCVILSTLNPVDVTLSK